MLIKRNDLLQNLQSHFDIEIFDHGHAVTGTDWNASLVNPPYSRLYFILDGDGYYRTNKETTFFEKSCCYLLPRGFSFNHGCKSSMEQVFFHLSLKSSTGYDLLNAVKNPLFCCFDRDKLLDCFYSDGICSVLKIKALISEYLWKLLEKSDTPLPLKEYSSCVSLALSHIHSQSNARLNLDELAECCFVSQTTLSKKFRNELNTTVSAYIDDMIFARAQLMLKNPELTIGFISDSLGFCDQFYFSRRFHMRYKESPGSYRKKVLM